MRDILCPNSVSYTAGNEATEKRIGLENNAVRVGFSFPSNPLKTTKSSELDVELRDLN